MAHNTQSWTPPIRTFVKEFEFLLLMYNQNSNLTAEKQWQMSWWVDGIDREQLFPTLCILSILSSQYFKIQTAPESKSFLKWTVKCTVCCYAHWFLHWDHLCANLLQNHGQPPAKKSVAKKSWTTALCKSAEKNHWAPNPPPPNDSMSR